MPILSYLVIPAPGAAARLEQRLSALRGCEVARAENRDLLLLVTETSSAAEDEALRASLAELDEIRSLILTFGNVDQ